jgi:hypothetical protein
VSLREAMHVPLTTLGNAKKKALEELNPESFKARKFFFGVNSTGNDHAL